MSQGLPNGNVSAVKSSPPDTRPLEDQNDEMRCLGS